VLLPLMHQSSLGTLMVLAGSKLSPLWQTGLLPLFNVLTALAMGYAVVVFEAYVSAVAFGRPFETPVLRKLSGVIPPLMIVFLVVRWGDLLLRGALGSAFSGTAGAMFWVENALFLAPVLLLAPAAARARGRTLCLASFLLLAGGTVFRFNYYLVGFDPGHGWRYFPSVAEIAITLGIVAAEILAYLVFVKRLPVLPEAEHA
jgi:Ni/Fe-hydrogenase subunit HybB-like protein